MNWNHPFFSHRNSTKIECLKVRSFQEWFFSTEFAAPDPTPIATPSLRSRLSLLGNTRVFGPEGKRSGLLLARTPRRSTNRGIGWSLASGSLYHVLCFSALVLRPCGVVETVLDPTMHTHRCDVRLRGAQIESLSESHLEHPQVPSKYMHKCVHRKSTPLARVFVYGSHRG